MEARQQECEAFEERQSLLEANRKGTNGVSTHGVTANFIVFLTGIFWYSR